MVTKIVFFRGPCLFFFFFVLFFSERNNSFLDKNQISDFFIKAMFLVIN